MSTENSELREDALSPMAKQIWQSVFVLQSKYGNADTKIRLLEEGAMVSKPQVHQVMDAKLEFVRSNNLSQAEYAESNQYRNSLKAEASARVSATEQLQSAWALDEMKKIASPEKTFANHAIWTAARWNAYEDSCDVCRGSGQLRCSACGGNPRIKCKWCKGWGSTTCRECVGSGSSMGRPCGSCGGRGSIKCSSCRGKGYSGYCTSCKNGKVTCNTCDGRRRVYKGVVGRVSVNSSSYIEQDEDSPLHSKDRNSAKWICSQADGYEQVSSEVISGQLNVKWRLSVSKPYICYQVGSDKFLSEVEGKSMSTLWHGRFLDQALEAVLKKANEAFQADVEAEEKLKQACEEFRSGKLSTEILRLVANRHRDTSQLSKELKGSVSESLLTRGFEFANKLIDEIADLSGRKWLHWGCLGIGIASILIFALDRWSTPSKWLNAWFGMNLNPLETMILVPLALTILLAGVFGLRTSFTAKRLTGFHMRPRRLSKRTKLHLLFGAFGSLAATILTGIVIAIFSK